MRVPLKSAKVQLKEMNNPESAAKRLVEGLRDGSIVLEETERDLKVKKRKAHSSVPPETVEKENFKMLIAISGQSIYSGPPTEMKIILQSGSKLREYVITPASSDPKEVSLIKIQEVKKKLPTH